MKRFFASLSVRIWLPFAIALILGMIGVAYYYSDQQARLLRKNAELQIEEVANVLALSVELSMEEQNYAGLEKTINLSKDFEYSAIVQVDSIVGKETILFSRTSRNVLDSSIIYRPDPLRYIFRKKPVRSSVFNGYVMIANSTRKVELEIQNLEKPLFLIMAAVLGFFFLVFFAFARILARPVTYLTGVADELTRGNYDVAIEERSNSTEILDLNRSLVQLRQALAEARDRNEGFNRQLEEEIRSRTLDLENTRLRLLEAQDVARLGNYEINLDSGEWMGSDTIFSILKGTSLNGSGQGSWVQFFGKEAAEKLLQLFEQSINSGLPFQQDICLTNADGLSMPENWISISGRPMGMGGREERIVRGTIQDISERKKTEKEVKRLSLVAEKTSNCVIITDVERKILWVNESTLRLSGYSREEIYGKTPAIFQFEKTNPETLKEIREKLATLEEVNTEVVNKSKNGTEYWLQINIVPLFDENNTHIGFISVQNDITERVKFEQEIQRNEANYRSILENSSEMIHTIDNDGNLIWANRSWKEKLGLKGQKIEGLALSRFLDSRTLEEFQRIMPLLSEGEAATNLDCVFISTEGRSLNLEGRAIPIFEGPEVIGSQAYLHDITSIRKAENDLKQLLELTRRQNERLRNFTHIVSHNLRSHSSNLSGLIHLLRLEIPDIQNNIFYDNFNVAINNLMEVIQQLSEVALIHTEEDKEFDAVDLSEAIEKAIATVFGLARNAGVEIRNRIEGKSLVLGDPGYIDSIILNLLTNAIKYKSETRESFVEISAGSATDSFFCLEVRDNGLGIDLDRQGRKIFGMYKTFHKHQDARGVGLFMTKNQVEAMGGRIEVQSKIDEGTVFSVFLRLVADKSSGI